MHKIRRANKKNSNYISNYSEQPEALAAWAVRKCR